MQCKATWPNLLQCPACTLPPIGGIPGTGVTSIKAKIGNSRLLWPGPLLANLLICAHEGETSNGLIKVTIQTPLSGCVWVKNNQVCNKYSFHWHITPDSTKLHLCSCLLFKLKCKKRGKRTIRSAEVNGGVNYARGRTWRRIMGVI